MIMRVSVLTCIAALALGCGAPPSTPSPAGAGGSAGAGGGGGAGGAGGDGGSAEPACDAGAMYVCQCPPETLAGLGNKWCAWDGTGFSDCMLCGVGGPQPIEGTCSTASDCPGEDGPCKERACEGGKCVLLRYQPSSAPPDTVPNDCTKLLCDGDGEAVSVPDPSDCAGACNASGACMM